MRMTLRQLSVFASIATEGTVTKASERLLLTQSAASMALADLESAMGAPLFDRVGKRLQLNDLGRDLLPKALEILNRCEEFEHTARGETQQTNLKIGATLTIADYVIPELLSTFTTLRPDTFVTLEMANTAKIIHAVSHFALDLGFIEGSCHAPELEVTPWHEDELTLACSTEHPLAQLSNTKMLSVDDFQGTHWILREEGSGTREAFDQLILPKLHNHQIRMVIGNNHAVARLVAEAIGVCCASKLALRSHFDSGELVELPSPFGALKRQFFMLTHKQKYLSPGMRAFIEHAKTSGADL